MRFEVLLFVLFNFLNFYQVISDCQYWEAYKTEKCYKIIKARFFTFESAVKACNEYKNGSLLVIEDSEEQDFLKKFVFEANKIVDNVWIGLKRDNKTGQFQWVDRSPLVYQNWAKNNPNNRTGDCVYMTSNDGKWNNVDCNKKSIVVCQKPNEISMSDMQKVIKQMERKLKVYENEQKTMKNEQKELRNENVKVKSDQQKLSRELIEVKQAQHNFSSIPIGFIFVQLSNQIEPKLLFPNTKWSDISQQYAGLFFRTLGGSSADFGRVQEEASPRITEASSVWSDRDNFQNMKFFDENPDGTSRWTVRARDSHGDGILTGSHNLKGVARHLRFKLSMSEVRPKNMAVKIWKRVK